MIETGAKQTRWMKIEKWKYKEAESENCLQKKKRKHWNYISHS